MATTVVIEVKVFRSTGEVVVVRRNVDELATPQSEDTEASE